MFTADVAVEEAEGGGTRLVMPQCLVQDVIPEIRKTIETEVMRNGGLLIDLAHTKLIDSCGWGLLISSYRRHGPAGRLHIINLHGDPLQFYHDYGFHLVMRIEDGQLAHR